MIFSPNNLCQKFVATCPHMACWGLMENSKIDVYSLTIAFKGVVTYYQAAQSWKYTPLEGVKPVLALSKVGLRRITMVCDIQVQR